MPHSYRTVFEVSYLSNGAVFFGLLPLVVTASLLAVSALIWHRLPAAEAASDRHKFTWFQLIVTICASISAVFFFSTVSTAHKLTQALALGRCNVVEGPVHVLQEEPWGGHRSTLIQIGNKVFGYSRSVNSVAYHGGELQVDGIDARVHYLGGAILKVEINL